MKKINTSILVIAVLLVTLNIFIAAQHRLQRRCKEPVFNENCKSAILRWHYSKLVNKCLPFYYGGCKGNGHIFKTFKGCMAICQKKRVVGPPDYDLYDYDSVDKENRTIGGWNMNNQTGFANRNAFYSIHNYMNCRSFSRQLPSWNRMWNAGLTQNLNLWPGINQIFGVKQNYGYGENPRFVQSPVDQNQGFDQIIGVGQNKGFDQRSIIGQSFGYGQAIANDQSIGVQQNIGINPSLTVNQDYGYNQNVRTNPIMGYAPIIGPVPVVGIIEIKPTITPIVLPNSPMHQNMKSSQVIMQSPGPGNGRYKVNYFNC